MNANRISHILAVILATASCACASPLLPQLANAGFEDDSLGGWAWSNRAKASYRSEAAGPHSGSRCVVFTNESGLAPEIYGRLTQTVAITPGIEYELGAWVRADAVADGNHLTDWNSYHLDIPPGTYGWRRVATRFKAKADQNHLNVGINIVNRCRALAVDDIEIVPVGVPLSGDVVAGRLVAPAFLIGGDAAAGMCVIVTSCTVPQARLRATVRAGRRLLLDKQQAVKPGGGIMQWQWKGGAAGERRIVCEVTVTDAQGRSVASASQAVECLATALSDDISSVAQRLGQLDALLAKCHARRIPADYPAAARALAEQFIPLVRDDIAKNEMRRAQFAIGDLAVAIDEAIAELKSYLADPSLAPIVQRHRLGGSKGARAPGLAIEGSSFIGNRKDSRGATSRGPVFFCGYGHFFQVRRDIPRFPAHGANIIQVEVGPAITMPLSNTVDLAAANDIVKVLDDAARHDVMVNVLLSPHYFPKWALDKWPHLARGGGGFLGYCVDDTEAKQVIEKFLRTVVPLLRNKPALHSLCLSNEPVLDRTADCSLTRGMWEAYLARTHDNVETMNANYGTSYTAFASVPIPGNDAYGAPQFTDFCAFNAERFAAWHAWMAGIIHEIAPGIPVHAKAMSMALNWRHSVAWGVDPERFGGFSQINGNDCWIAPVADRRDDAWAIAWHVQNISYDLQRSLALRPIFNSENHPTVDRSTCYVPPEHFRTVLWQGAVHGQGATTIWVWERTLDRGHDFYGNVMDRPGCALAVGTTCLDLNRFASEVTALQNEPAPAAILFSTVSTARDASYVPAAHRIYEALNFRGVKVDFISERQLAAGKGAKYRMLLFPECGHVTSQTAETCARLPESVRLVIAGNALSANPYMKPFPASLVRRLRERALLVPAGTTDTRALSMRLRGELERLGALPPVDLVDRATGKPAWGVEWLSTTLGGGRLVVNMVNLLGGPVDVELRRGGQAARAVDLLGRGPRSEVRRLRPLVPVLAQVE